MRALVVALAVAALAGLGPATAQAKPRALIALLPVEGQRFDRLAEELTGRGLAPGLTSAALGAYSERQLALDLSQGARAASQVYEQPLEPFDLVPAGSRRGRIANFDAVERRAAGAPANVVPGLLAETLRRAGRTVAYAGMAGEPHYGAVIAAGRDGTVYPAVELEERDYGARATRLWRRADLLVARLPAERRGLAALDRLLAERRPRDLVYVLAVAPAGERPRLLPTGVAGIDAIRGAAITSDSTRQSCLVAFTDVGPTVLRRLV